MSKAEPAVNSRWPKAGKHIIVKMQWPIATQEDPPPVLIYDHSRRYECTIPGNAQVKWFMRGRLKCFALATLVPDQGIPGKYKINILAMVRDQNW